MTHCLTEEMLLDYVAGRLAPADRSALEDHAARCTQCAHICSTQAEIWRGMDEWKPVPVSTGFNRELWRRIDSESESTWAQVLRNATMVSFWKPVAPLALAVALVVMGFIFDHSRMTRNALVPAGDQQAQVIFTTSDADQIERALDDIQLLHEVDAEAVRLKPEQGVM